MKNAMRNVLLVLIVTQLMLFGFFGCSPQEAAKGVENDPTQVEESTIEQVVGPIDKPTATPEPVPLSVTTGLPFDGEYKPILAVIENSPAARPQLGLQTADIVYEVPVEGSITRFLCLFSDTVPEEIMPVRSGRVPFLYIVHEYDAIFMHFGGSGSGSSTNSPHNIYTHHLRDEEYDVDGLSGRWSDYFYRSDEKTAPHNVVGRPLLAQQTLYNYQPEVPNWIFDEEVVYNGDDGTEISLQLCSGKDGYVSYTYDENSGCYWRFMNGERFMSAETGEQVKVTNIILQYSSYTTSSKVKLWEMVGGGKADYYINGVKISGTWKRKDEDSNTIFYDGDGRQIVMRPGNTWINICPEDK